MCPTPSGSNGTTDGFFALYAPHPDFKAQKLLDIAYTILITLFASLLFSTSLQADEHNSSKAFASVRFFTDEGDLDLSDYLSQAYGLLPVPIIITEPAVGYGGGAELIYLHDKFTGRKGASGRNIPPSISGVILAGTENDTKIAGGFHLGYYLEDTLRTQTFVMLTDINTNFYTPADRAVFMNLKNPIFYQSFKYRFGESDFFAGISYLYTSSEVSLKHEEEDNDIDLPPWTTANAATGLILDYDTRDNTLSPNKGMLFNARANFFGDYAGSDNTFQKYFLQELLYIPLGEKINFDQRFVFDSIGGGEAPFYMYPFVAMRGVPAMRYQGENVALYEAQLSYDIGKRWRLLAFGGVARAYGSRDTLLGDASVSFRDAPTVATKGVGFRYLIAEKFGLRMGIDIAKSNEDTAFYIQFGTAWFGL